MTGAVIGVVGAGVVIEAPAVAATGFSAGSSFASLTWDDDGTIDKVEDLTNTNDFDDWMIPNGGEQGGNYEIKFEQSAGDTLDAGSDSLSTWHALSTPRTLQLAQSGSGSKSANGTYIIRRASSTELDNGTWQLDVTVP